MDTKRTKSFDLVLFGAGNQNRTDDLVITNDVLYRLSHTSITGGERGIRTLVRVLALTRFPVVRLRPAQPSLRACDFVIIAYLKQIVKPFSKNFLIFSFSTKLHDFASFNAKPCK